MKIRIVAFLLLMAFGSTLSALSFNNGCDYASIGDSDYATMQSNLTQSVSLLQASQNLLSISNQLLANPSSANMAYISAMLRLADDIGTMADRIGTMADRIVAEMKSR